MTVINLVTKLSPSGGNVLTEADIQAHLDAQNADGYELVALDNLVGWYRFFWKKSIE